VILFNTLKQSICICSITERTPKKNTIKTCEFVLSRFTAQFSKRDLASISQEEVMAFLLYLTKNNKQATKRNRYSVLSSFYSFSINNALPALNTPCNTPVIKKIFKRPQTIQWQIVDKETIDEIIFRTMNIRNRIMLELMARGGMRIGETVYVPRKLLVRLNDYVRANNFNGGERIFPISYVTAWSMVKKAGKLVDIELRPHDLSYPNLNKIQTFFIDA
jgi:site-specific recombinase XerD